MTQAGFTLSIGIKHLMKTSYILPPRKPSLSYFDMILASSVGFICTMLWVLYMHSRIDAFTLVVSTVPTVFSVLFWFLKGERFGERRVKVVGQ